MIVRILVRQTSRLTGRSVWRFARVARFDEAYARVCRRLGRTKLWEEERYLVKREQRRALREEW